MADGKVTLPYAQFLGYEKGKDRLPQVVLAEAEIVRLIFRLFMEGKTFSAIAKYLTTHAISSPAGKETWQAAVVQSILKNEKYKGHALLQKTYCANFLTKKMVKNTGQVQQYYVENSHPAIIDPDEFDAVQAEIERRKSQGNIGRCKSPLSGKIVCGEYGGFYGKKVWGSYKSDKTYRREVYQCNDKYKHNGKDGKQCGTPFVTEDEVKERFLTAFNNLMAKRDGLIEDCRLAQTMLCDATVIDSELADLRREIEVVTELSRKAICENARTAVDQAEYTERNNGYLERRRKAAVRIEKLEALRRERLAKALMLDRFIADIESRPLVLSEFDEALWLMVIDRATVATDGTMSFAFRNGSEVTA
jgi:putative hemolysin